MFGGVAGDSMAVWVPDHGAFRDPDRDVIDEAVDDCMRPVGRVATDLEHVREALFDTMWDRVGITRNGEGLASALRDLDALSAELDDAGVGGRSRAYNVSWHDWMNLRNLVLVSRSIATAALERENSRGAHYREDFTVEGDLGASAFTRICYQQGRLITETEAVNFTRVSPGQSLLDGG